MLRFDQDHDTLVNQRNEGKQDGKGTGPTQPRADQTRPRHPHVIPWLDAEADSRLGSTSPQNVQAGSPSAL